MNIMVTVCAICSMEIVGDMVNLLSFYIQMTLVDAIIFNCSALNIDGCSII